MDVDKRTKGPEMYDLIASWMTSGGPLQELRRDDSGGSREVRPTVEPTTTEPMTAPRRHAHLSLPFTRGAHGGQTLMTAPCTDGCAAG
jgi:hypothetical protein